MSVQNLRTKILQKLNQMSTLKAAYDWETSNPNGNYPFATLTLDKGTSEFRSNYHNLRTHTFRVRIYQERSKIGQGPETAEDIVNNIIDEVYTAFDMDTTLSGTCKYVMPVGYDASYLDREHDCRLLQINIDAIELTSSR